MASVVDLAEESLRIIKALKKSKDAESSWTIDVGDLLGSYLQAIESSEQLAKEYEATHEHDDSDVFGDKHHSLPTLNFSTASTIVSEATRVFSRKVDYLAIMVDTTMMNLTSGAIMGSKAKKSKLKERKLNQKIRGFQALQDWNLPLIPEAADLLHLPWTAWSKGGSQLLPEEECLYQSNIASLISSDAPFDQFCRTLMSENLKFTPAPRCVNPRELADKKKQCIFRPLISLMPRPEETSSSAEVVAIGPAAVRQLITNSKLASSTVHSSGCLSIPFCANYLQSVPTRFDGTPLIGGGVIPTTPFVGMSVTPGDQPTFRSARVSLDVPAEPRRVAVKRRVRGGQLDEHERLGRDAPLRVGKLPQRPAVDGIKLSQVEYGGLAWLTCRGLVGWRKFLDSNPQTQAQVYQQVNDWKVRNKVKYARAVHVDPDKLPSHFPLFEDVRRPDNLLSRLGFVHPQYAVLGPKLSKRIRQSQAKHLKLEEVVGEEGVLGEEDGLVGDEGLVGDDGDEGFVGGVVGEGGSSDSEAFTWTSPADTLFDKVLSVAQETPEFTHKEPPDSTSLYKMHERVWRWTQYVETWIVRSASLGPFIVSDYISKIASRVKDAVVPKTDQLVKPDGCQKSAVVSFRQLVTGCERHEVCRLFLTSLVLANTHGYQLHTVRDDAGGAELLIWGDEFTEDRLTADHFDGPKDRPDDAKKKKKRPAGGHRGDTRKQRRIDSSDSS